eukprot:TRINITY_DN10315_c0_g1_i1.p1 TRINITY_DN10315_c0_g1~~TRINITY_DN10315_c0_g1_i1.p1  ORF type:complete len:374 (+),score=97.53 TRINITY_DN10315_c0_g1_i1:283-1404(+)
MRRSAALQWSARKQRSQVRHWDLVHDLIEQDTAMGLNKTQKAVAPWPVLPPVDIGTMEQEWLRYRNVAQLVANGAIQPPKWYRQSRLSPPTSGPFWGDPPVHSVEHQYPLRRHWWTQNLKPPTELMKVFFLRKEDRVFEKNYKRIIGFTPKEKARQRLKDDVRDAAASGRSTFNFFWQKKPLEKMETRFWRLREEGVAEGDAHRMVAKEYYETLAVRKRQQSIAAETARRSGKAISAYQGYWVLDLLTTLQRHQIDRSLAEAAGKDLASVTAAHYPEIIHGEKPPADDEHDATSEETTRYLQYTGLQPDMMAFEQPVISQHRPPIFDDPVAASQAVEEEQAERVLHDETDGLNLNADELVQAASAGSMRPPEK